LRHVWLRELFDSVPSDILAAELDLHWIARGGGNPEAWIRYLSDRVPVLHFKDFIIADGKPHFCEVGEGNLDWSGILAACVDADVRWYIVEQDQPFGNRDLFESLQISFENLKRMGVK
jgi:sugar phosphate isomerase/epimerase